MNSDWDFAGFFTGSTGLTPHPAARPTVSTIDAADKLAEAFKALGEWGSYHHVRAMAHEMGYHLSSCPGGKRLADPLDMSEEVRWTA
jgi:hypothetical protein